MVDTIFLPRNGQATEKNFLKLKKTKRKMFLMK